MLGSRLAFLLHITRTHAIMRRYFVVNGFDGALTMLGLITGFLGSDEVPPRVALGACLGAAVALTVSGISSAYISERAERRKELAELEAAMMADLGRSRTAARQLGTLADRAGQRLRALSLSQMVCCR